MNLSRFVLVVFAALLVVAAAFAWLASNASQEVPVATASKFLSRLHAKQFVEAFALTAGGPLTGVSAFELERVSDQQLCSVAELPVSTHPAQTNGNRLRRWLMRTEIEMPEVSVEFVGGCLLRVTLRRLPSGDWRVQQFVSHAG